MYDGVTNLAGGSHIINISYVTLVTSGTTDNATATIPELDTANSVAVYLGGSTINGPSKGNMRDAAFYAEFTNSTTLKVTRDYSIDYVSTIQVMIVEYKPSAIESIQHISVDIAAWSNDKTQGISSVDMAKTEIRYAGLNNAGATTGALYGAENPRFWLDSTTQVKAHLSSQTGAIMYIKLAVVEFK